MAKKKRLGEVLIDAGLINDTQLSASLQSQRTWGGKLGSTLVRMGFVREEDILKALSSQLLLPAVDFNKVKISPRAIRAVPLRIAEKYHVIPVALREELGKRELVLVMSDPTNIDTITEIEFQTGTRIRPAVATDSSINRAIDYYYRSSGQETQETSADRVDIVSLDEDEKMQLVEEDRFGANLGEGPGQSLETLGSGALLKLVLRVLIRKGVLTKNDLVQEFHRRKS